MKNMANSMGDIVERNKWIENFKKKKLILFGCGNTASEFYQKTIKNCNWDIHLCYSNYGRENEFVVEGVKIADVKRPELADEKKGYFIIICSLAFNEISEQLVNLGYRPFEDFVTKQFLEAMINEKKIAVAYGICQLRAVVQCLNKTNSFRKQYELYYFESYNKDFILEAERLFLITLCDLFIYTKGISEAERIKMSGVLKRLHKKCLAIGLSAISFCGYFLKNDVRIDVPNPYSVISRKSSYVPFRFSDEYINFLIDQKCTIDEIYEKAMSYGMNKEKEIQDKCHKELTKLKYIDSNGDIHIAEYIRKMYKKQRLFRNEAHIENLVAVEYTNQICDLLTIKFDMEDLEEPLMNHSQHIIYPSVHKALELEWEWENTEYDLFTYNGWKKVTFYEFIQAYVQYCSSIKELIEAGLVPMETEKLVYR